MSSPAENLHVPQSKSGSALNSQSVKSIMDAYKTQSKIQLYDESSAQSQGAGNENIGVTGRNIPLSMLRPSANPVQDVDENGNIIVRQRPSRGRMLQEAEAYGDIAKAYKAAGVPFEFHMFENGHHGLSLGTKEVNTVNESIQPWLDLSITWLKGRGFDITD